MSSYRRGTVGLVVVSFVGASISDKIEMVPTNMAGTVMQISALSTTSSATPVVVQVFPNTVTDEISEAPAVPHRPSTVNRST